MFLTALLGSIAGLTVIVVVSLRDAMRVIRSLRWGKRTQGQIVRDQVVFLGKGRFHYPVVIFRDEMGTSYEVQTRYERITSTSAREQMGEVEIAYLPTDPQRTAVLVGIRYYLHHVLLTTAFVSIGVACVVASLVLKQKLLTSP